MWSLIPCTQPCGHTDTVSQSQDPQGLTPRPRQALGPSGTRTDTLQGVCVEARGVSTGASQTVTDPARGPR